MGHPKEIRHLLDKFPKQLETAGISLQTLNLVGVFYDNPNVVPHEQCRFIGGVIADDVRDFKSLKAKLHQKQDVIEGGPFRVLEVPKARALVVRWPTKGLMSILTGVYKVYPRLTARLVQFGPIENGILEIYNMKERFTEFVGVVDKLAALQPFERFERKENSS